jgi:hypothetical protein
MGFGSLGTVMYLHELISKVTLNETHGTTPSGDEMKTFLMHS